MSVFAILKYESCGSPSTSSNVLIKVVGTRDHAMEMRDALNAELRRKGHSPTTSSYAFQRVPTSQPLSLKDTGEVSGHLVVLQSTIRCPATNKDLISQEPIRFHINPEEAAAFVMQQNLYRTPPSEMDVHPRHPKNLYTALAVHEGVVVKLG